MFNLHVPVFPVGQGDRLAPDNYRRDFRRRDSVIMHRSSWKLERRQHFEELGNESWEACRRGDWAEALRLLDAEQRRSALVEVYQDDERRHSYFHRVRVIQKPLTPYMQWELNSQRVRAECGERIRVVDADLVAKWEIESLLPEVVVLGGSTIYQVLYTEAGVPDGAIRHTDPALIASWEYFIKALYELGEDVRDYVRREVAHLPAPHTGGAAADVKWERRR